MYGGDRWWEKPDYRREGDFVWLPMTFDADTPVVNYYQDWELNIEAGTWRPFDYSRNLAMRKTATASSSIDTNVASRVTDSTTYLNYTNTRWESAASDPQWIMVDLGLSRNVNRAILKWHENYAKSFKIQTSVNGSTWTDVYSTTKGASRSVTDVAFDQVTARYVRMYGTQRGTSNGYSLFDFMVLNDTLSTPVFAPGPAEKASAYKAYFCRQNGQLAYVLPNTERVKLEVFDMLGKLVDVPVNGFQSAGRHEVFFSGKTYRSGIYMLRLHERDMNVVTTATQVKLSD